MSAGWESPEDHREVGLVLDGDASTAEKARRLAAVEPLVRAMCAKRLGTRGADDAAQAVLEQVWRAQHQQVFDSEEAVRRYAATVARVMSPHDDRRSALATPAGELADVLWADEGPGPAEQAERAEAIAQARQRVSDLLSRLSPRERAVIEAVHFGEKSNAEVAEELGISPSGVRSASVRAMARLRGEVGAVSPNPLAHGVPVGGSVGESKDRRRAARADAGELSTGPVSVSVSEAARAFAAAHGRTPSRSELEAETGTSSGTAAHVLRALRAERGEPYAAGTPVRDRTEAAALGFLAEQGRAPTPGELRRLTETSDHTARSVLRGLVGPRPAAREEGQVEGAGPVEGRRASPAFDRAEVAAREVFAETGRMPNWRQIAERADVGRSTAAEVRRALRAHQLDEQPLAQGDTQDQAQDEARNRIQDEAGDQSWDQGRAPYEPSCEPSVTSARRSAVLRAQDDVARAVERAQHPASAGETADDAAGLSGGQRTRQLALWSADDLERTEARATGEDADDG